MAISEKKSAKITVLLVLIWHIKNNYMQWALTPIAAALNWNFSLSKKNCRKLKTIGCCVPKNMRVQFHDFAIASDSMYQQLEKKIKTNTLEIFGNIMLPVTMCSRSKHPQRISVLLSSPLEESCNDLVYHPLFIRCSFHRTLVVTLWLEKEIEIFRTIAATINFC